MKHTDLMLNDLVMCQGKILRVGCISDYDIKIDLFEDGEDTPYAEIWQEELDEVKPTPLTAEILEKNGWKDVSDHTLKGCETFKLHYEQEGFDYYITIKLRDYFKLDSYDDRFYTLCKMEFGCRYVHELQHALRLCGVDKEIVL